MSNNNKKDSLEMNRQDALEAFGQVMTNTELLIQENMPTNSAEKEVALRECEKLRLYILKNLN